MSLRNFLHKSRSCISVLSLTIAIVGCDQLSTPAPTSAPDPLLASRPSCIPLQEASLEVGSRVCVEGKVVSSYNKANDFYMIFAERDRDFYVIGRNYFLLDIDGHCIRVIGVVETLDDKLFIVGSDPGNFENCTSLR